jgi:hypothetical protein
MSPEEFREERGRQRTRGTCRVLFIGRESKLAVALTTMASRVPERKWLCLTLKRMASLRNQ